MASRSVSIPRWKKLFYFLMAALASTVLLKLGQIQYLEILYAAAMLMLLRSFAQHGYAASWSTPFLRIGLLWLIFFVLAFIFAVCSLRFDFFYPADLGLLRYPVVITISRIAEVFASLFFMLYVSDEIRLRPWIARYTMRVYYWVGFASAVYSIASLPLNLAGIADLGTFNADHRMRGFYNEGGPYGLYLISVFLVGVALYKNGWQRKQGMLWSFAALAIAFLGSQSKAAIIAALCLAFVNIFLVGTFARRMILLASVGVFVAIAAQIVDLGRVLRTYQQSSAAYEQISHLHKGDPNFVLGRVAGAFIVPRMIAAHPWTGIGWGNYGILRNAPEYRGASAWAELADDPGLGIIGTAADLGLPLLIYLLACLFVPVAFVLAQRSPPYLLNLALLQPTAHLFGAQLNLTYPWIVSAFALGLCACLKTNENSYQEADISTKGAITSRSRPEGFGLQIVEQGIREV